MKKLFFFFLAIAASVSSFAYYGETKLTINSYTQRNVTVSIDGYNRSNGYNNNITITDLNGGNHNVKIYQEQRGIFGRTSNKLIYDANIYLRPNFETYLTINSDGNVEVREQPLYNNGGYNSGGYGKNNGRGNNDPYNNGYKNKQKKAKKKHDNRRYDDDDDNWKRNDGGWNNGNNNSGNYRQVMNAQSFEQFKQTIRREAFEHSKQSTAKQVIGSNYFTAAQVREVVQLFSFDNSKLDIAKYAYTRCVDTGNYYVIYDVFAHSSSRDELTRYTQSVR